MRRFSRLLWRKRAAGRRTGGASIKQQAGGFRPSGPWERQVNPKSAAEIQTPSGDTLVVPLSPEGGRDGARLVIDGVPYHFERVRREELLSRYQVDDDPGYAPEADADGFCYILAPYSA